MPLAISIIILGIIEGITEFLPISSTGHLLLAQHWLPKQSDLFNVVIQSGAVIAVIPLFKERFHQFIYRYKDPVTLDYLLKLLVSFLITCVGGFIMEKKKLKLPEELAPVAWALLIGGIAFLVVEQLVGKKKSGSYIGWDIAIGVGLGQLVAAAFPGASRSGTTIMIMLLLGLNRVAATEFTFLVSIPTMLAAGGYKILKTLKEPAVLGAPKEDWSMVILGTVVAAIVSFIAVKWLLRYVQSHTFNSFGWYRIVLAILVFFIVFQEKNKSAELHQHTSVSRHIETRTSGGIIISENAISIPTAL